jgi:hypothetical protein
MRRNILFMISNWREKSAVIIVPGHGGGVDRYSLVWEGR